MDAIGTNSGLNTPVVDATARDLRELQVDSSAMSERKSPTEAGTAPKFGDVLKKLQGNYGGQAEKPRVAKKTMDKDDFLRIMVTQMKNQDPLEPFKAEKFAAELAQFTTVEQLQNINQGIAKLARANQPTEKMALTSMIGRYVTLDKERFSHVEKHKDTLSFNLSKDAAAVKVSVFSEQGELLTQKDLGEMKSGEGTFIWDGENAAGTAAKEGTYVFKVNATDDRGSPIQISTKSQAAVVGVTFEGSEPSLLVGDPAKPEKVAMRNVVRIELGPSSTGQSSPQIPGAQSLSEVSQRMSGAGGQQATAKPEPENQNMRPSAEVIAAAMGSVSPQQQMGQNKYQSLAMAAGNSRPLNGGVNAANISNSRVPPSGGDEKGFPNGLGGGDSK